MKKLIIVLCLCVGLFSCFDIDKKELKQIKEKRAAAEQEHAQLAQLPERMVKTWEHTGGFGDWENWYILKDTTNDKEYLIVGTGHAEGGIAIIELKKGGE